MSANDAFVVDGAKRRFDVVAQSSAFLRAYRQKSPRACSSELRLAEAVLERFLVVGDGPLLDPMQAMAQHAKQPAEGQPFVFRDNESDFDVNTLRSPDGHRKRNFLGHLQWTAVGARRNGRACKPVSSRLVEPSASSLSRQWR